ncbi:MAG TPA: Trp biosynthesis-associated membrane protein, partial [Jatrophihabitans sp.]|nr:Trp biosynthesis-associated membrane protein [Jatrophihabitans sp.]
MATAEPARSRSGERRELAGTVLLVLLGGALILLAAGRGWATAAVPRQPPFPDLRLSLTGRTLYPPLTGLAVVALSAAVLALVLGGWPRRLVGVLMLLLAGWS